MKKSTTKIICLILAIVMVAPSFVFAGKPVSNDQYITGDFKYKFTFPDTNKTSEYDDIFVYSEDWFKKDGRINNEHLATLSMEATMACSTADAEEVFLRKIGFSDFVRNDDFSTASETSMGCMIGSKTITANNIKYTLLAIVPRSFNYSLEWVSNFTIGKDGFHEGFKQGRDECLKLIKSYLKTHELENHVKVWIFGHSRGAAVANLTAAYLLDHPSIFGINQKGQYRFNSSNLYAYTFETPMGAPAYLARLDKYNGIHNYILEDDPVTMVAPVEFGFGRFGTDVYYGYHADADVEELYLNTYYNDFRDSTLLGGNPLEFEAKRLIGQISRDGLSFSIAASLDKKALKQGNFLKDRVSRLCDAVHGSMLKSKRANYVDGGYEELLQTILRYLETEESGKLEEVVTKHANDVIGAMLWMFIYYPYTKNAFNGAYLLVALNALNQLAKDGEYLGFKANIPDLIKDLLKELDISDIDLSGLENDLRSICSSAITTLLAPRTIATKKGIVKLKAAAAMQKLLNDFVEESDNDKNAYECMTEFKSALNAVDVLSEVTMGNDIRTPFAIIPLTISFNSVTLTTNSAELNNLLTFAENFDSLVSNHAHQPDISWLRAGDNLYIIADTEENTDAIHLYSAPGTKILYTLDGSKPSANTISSGETKIYSKLNGVDIPQEGCTLSAISIQGNEVSPVWEFVYSEKQPEQPVTLLSPTQEKQIEESLHKEELEEIPKELQEEPASKETILDVPEETVQEEQPASPSKPHYTSPIRIVVNIIKSILTWNHRK